MRFSRGALVAGFGADFVDYLSQLKRSRIRSKLLKRQREERRGA